MQGVGSLQSCLPFDGKKGQPMLYIHDSSVVHYNWTRPLAVDDSESSYYYQRRIFRHISPIDQCMVTAGQIVGYY